MDEKKIMAELAEIRDTLCKIWSLAMVIPSRTSSAIAEYNREQKDREVLARRQIDAAMVAVKRTEEDINGK